MNIETMTMADIEKRSAEIEEMMKAEDADIESLTAEVEQLEKRKAEIEKEDGTHAKVKFLSLTPEGMNFDPDADAE